MLPGPIRSLKTSSFGPFGSIPIIPARFGDSRHKNTVQNALEHRPRMREESFYGKNWPKVKQQQQKWHLPCKIAVRKTVLDEYILYILKY